MGPEIIIFLALMLGMMWFVTNRGKKQQAAARDRLEHTLIPGVWVVTIGGFLGKVVEIDGDVVTLETPAGDETIWLKTAIREAKEPPFAVPDEDGEADAVVVPDDASALLSDGAAEPGQPGPAGADEKRGDSEEPGPATPRA
ncbi:MAG: preprotein translocase subunit YajC [Georgenia sp.]